jgi:hypothetical protein
MEDETNTLVDLIIFRHSDKHQKGWNIEKLECCMNHLCKSKIGITLGITEKIWKCHVCPYTCTILVINVYSWIKVLQCFQSLSFHFIPFEGRYGGVPQGSNNVSWPDTPWNMVQHKIQHRYCNLWVSEHTNRTADDHSNFIKWLKHWKNRSRWVDKLTSH